MSALAPDRNFELQKRRSCTHGFQHLHRIMIVVHETEIKSSQTYFGLQFSYVIKKWESMDITLYRTSSEKWLREEGITSNSKALIY